MPTGSCTRFVSFVGDDGIRLNVIVMIIEWKTKDKGNKETTCCCVIALPDDADPDDGDSLQRGILTSLFTI